MSTSTLTKLQVANDVALSVGELKVTSLTSLVGQQLDNAIRSAVREINLETNFFPLRARVNADSWTNEIATLSTVVPMKTYGVYYDTSSGNEAQLQWQDYASFKTLYATYDEEGVGRYWTIPDEDKYLVLPYPAAADQSKVYFDIQKELEFPSTDAGTFGFADRYVHLIRLKSSEIFAEHHDGQGAGQVFLQQYLEFARKLKTNYQRRPQGGDNMYKRRRRGGNA